MKRLVLWAIAVFILVVGSFFLSTKLGVSKLATGNIILGVLSGLIIFLRNKRDPAIHIFFLSAATLGVCLTGYASPFISVFTCALATTHGFSNYDMILISFCGYPKQKRSEMAFVTAWAFVSVLSFTAIIIRYGPDLRKILR